MLSGEFAWEGWDQVPKSWTVRVAAVVLLMAVAGLVAVWGAPEGGRVTGIWPAGLATGALLLARRRLTGLLLVAIFTVALGTVWLPSLVSDNGRPFGVSLGFALGSALEAWIVSRLFSDGRDPRPHLRSDADLRRYFYSVAAGGAVVAVAGFLTAVVTDWGDPGLVAASIATAHVASNLALIPFFCRLPNQESIASPGERIFQWLTIVTVTPAVFLPDDYPSLVFLAVPVLAWGALRLSPREALAQMVAVLAFAIVMTTAGTGPFADVPERYGMSVDARGLMLAAFAIVCATIVVPLMIRVGDQIASAREAKAERDIVQRIVDGATGVAIVGSDEAGRITLYNPGAQRLLGYERSEVLGQHSTMFHTRAAIRDKAREFGVRDDVVDVVRELTKSGAAGTLIRFRRKDGVERTHAMTLSRLTDDKGRTTGYVSTSEDATDQLEAQRALEEALEVERQAVERLREVDTAKDAFVSSVSHELRTPMTSILGYLEMLGEDAFGPLSDDQRNAVRRVSSNTHRLLGLIDDLLTLSRVDNDGFDYVDRVFDLREAVQAAYVVVSPSWEERGLQVSLRLPDEPVPLLGDRDMIERVALNLVSNAVKFTPGGGSVDVDLSTAGDHADLVVTDTGIGVPEQEQAQLFDRFFRSTLAQKQAIPGSGLGLSITRAIVEKHGGAVSFTSQAGEGTVFRVRLPIVV
ncbi:ATP-binding protein [Nocardioides sp. cx-173]|uniref:ATP-binding protein n=1 Tax=Nocardioides sp. cx-173 TaxID=2898796 RepID=UPI001E2AC6CF|nr:ATP-binding protein [Nocardioides sp. cx-173]MCD4527434.1 ATP-binding protein [Nocardioides sp. cx-173]UGB41003.1 ATP-binding protein [Nocardioides sp. cx-173]